MVKSGPTIYVVDDDASVRRAVSRLLKSAGFQVETFMSAQEFLDSGQTEGPGAPELLPLLRRQLQD